MRVVCADGNPAGPGIITEPVGSAPVPCAAARPERSPQGSYARIDRAPRCLGEGHFSVTCLVYPTRLAGSPKVIASVLPPPPADSPSRSTSGTDSASPSGTGRRCARCAAVSRPLTERRWIAVWLVVDTDAAEVTVGWAALSPPFGEPRTLNTSSAPLPAGAVPGADAPLLLAASNHALPVHHFNGKLEAPAVFARPLAGRRDRYRRRRRHRRRGERVLGLLARRRLEPHRGHRPRTGCTALSSTSRRGGMDRLAVDRTRDVLASCAARVRGHPLPRGRHR